ncbi:MAG: hypothetical protein K2Q34_03635 [Alphaproteobacteria bacterium]|nr:hypothetical protein [Alphaproteobacteria bacterium]
MMISHKSFLGYIKIAVSSIFLLASNAYACVTIDFDNQTDELAVLTNFSKHYSNLEVTKDMEIDRDGALEIFINYPDFFKYFDGLRTRGVARLGEKDKDFIEFTIGGDAFTVRWDDNLSVSLKNKKKNNTYDVKLEDTTDRKTGSAAKTYKLVLTKR